MEQLRTEAEKVLQENYTESIKGIESISTPHFPKAYNECAIKSMLDFHAQQSKERDMFTIGFHRWLKENCKRTMYLFEYRYKGVKYNDEQLLEIYKSTLTK